MQQLVDLCLRYRVTLVSDEVHADLVYAPHQHTVTATIGSEIAQQSITFFAPSKTFNIAGLQTAYAVIPNPEIREKFVDARRGMQGGNLFGYVATEAAYREGEAYLTPLLQYLQGNRDFLYKELMQRFPQMKPILPEATYLMWVDFSQLGMNSEELRHWLVHCAGLGFNDGPSFGTGGTGFQRVNFGTPRSFIMEAIERLDTAITELKI